MIRHSFKLSILVISILLAAVSAEGAQKDSTGKFDQSLRRGETRATLDPDMFRDPYIRNAYQVAKEIPWILDSIYCYCKCEESPVFKHKSLLSCYVDNHASM